MAATPPPATESRRGATLAAAAALGAITVLGFAPFYLFALPVVTLALLMRQWRGTSPYRAAVIGFAFGLGMFLCGVSWVYVSLHDFGAMPAPLAVGVTLLFCAYLALFPALSGYLFSALPLRGDLKLALFLPAAWTLLEWTRGWLFTGFPWLALGYSQVPASPLAGLAPVFGVYGISLATLMTAGAICHLAFDSNGAGTASRKWRWAIAVFAIWCAGYLLKQAEWSRPAGAAVSVSLLQGNVPQDQKWRADRIRTTLESYRALIESSRSRLIILPETAFPLFLDDVPPEYLRGLAERAKKNNADILVGVPERLRSGEYYNTVLSLGTAATQRYRKSHLVPFGEFIPLRPLLGPIVSVLAIPLQDFSRGAAMQQPLDLAGQKVAVNVCYEDAFGEEIIRQLPDATLLVNVSNVAWFGHSIAPQQHLQISQARALESARYMLRATNTGETAVVNQRGEIVKAAPEFTRAVVTEDIPGMQGATPYVRWGNYGMLALCAALLAASLLGRDRRLQN